MELTTLIQMVLFSIGVSYVITGSKIGYPLRFTWCFIFHKKPLNYLWSLATCPPCNSWWVGFLSGLVITRDQFLAIQVAFTTCGLVAIVQGISMGIGLQGDEDFNEVFYGSEEEPEEEKK